MKPMAIKKQIENSDFVCMLVVQCKILQIVNIPSKAMQCKTIDLISAINFLQTAAENIAQLRRSFDAVLTKLPLFYMGFAKTLFKQKSKENKRLYFDEISEGITLSDPRKQFCVTMFFCDVGHTFLPTN